MSPIDIRKADRRDVAFLAQGNAAMAEETEGKHLDLEKLEHGVRGLYDHPEYGFYVVAELDGHPAAQMMITYEWSDWRNKVFWWIQSVYVLPACRQRGLYRTMHQWVAEEAAKSGACGLRLYVEKENGGAQETYARCGMHPSSYVMFEQYF